MSSLINMDEYIKDLQKITNIASETGNFKVSKAISELLKDKLEKSGAVVETRQNWSDRH